MKKRIVTLLLALVLLVTTLVVPASAAEASRFSDVTDRNTETAVEALRLMGVLDGYGDGTFRPSGILTRAQFCKMAAYITDSEAELGRYRTATIFPDVNPSHWAVSYINLAAKGKGIIAGYPDGTFQPERTVTVGHAVTILLRLLGYKDEEIGGVWPDSYMAVADMIGLTEGIPAGGNAPLTRAQAARLFLNLLDTEKNGGGTLYTLSKETDLRSVDGSTGELKTSDGTYTMVHPVVSTSLVGAKGYVVLNGAGKALTFLPITSGNGGTAAAAIVVAQDRSSAGFSELAGSSTYGLYKNGLPIGSGDLRVNDVASYYPATNSIRVCDTRVSVYYESCEPSPAAPTKLTVLGGTEFPVLPSAMDSVAAFKPGQQMTLLLTADGQVAAAVQSKGYNAQGNAHGIVSADGTVSLLCGSALIPLNAKADAKYYGQVVRISASRKDTLDLSVVSGGVVGDLNVTTKTLGSTRLAENAMLFDYGEQISLSDITTATVSKSQISYARTNWAGQVDLLVLNTAATGDVLYGWAAVRKVKDGDTVLSTTVEIISGDKSTGEIETNYAIDQSGYVEATMKNGRFTSIRPLTRLKGVSASSWIGTELVVYNGYSYTVPKTVLCYNDDTGDWITLEQALAYATSADLYVKDGVVRVIEVTHRS